MALRKFIIERDIPAVGSLEREQLRGALNGGGKSVKLRSSAGSISIRSAAAKTAMQ